MDNSIHEMIYNLFGPIWCGLMWSQLGCPMFVSTVGSWHSFSQLLLRVDARKPRLCLLPGRSVEVFLRILTRLWDHRSGVAPAHCRRETFSQIVCWLSPVLWPCHSAQASLSPARVGVVPIGGDHGVGPYFLLLVGDGLVGGSGGTKKGLEKPYARWLSFHYVCRICGYEDYVISPHKIHADICASQKSQFSIDRKLRSTPISWSQRPSCTYGNNFHFPPENPNRRNQQRKYQNHFHPAQKQSCKFGSTKLCQTLTTTQ